MNAPTPRYVIGISGRTTETLAAQADTLATYLDATERDPRRAAFAGTVTLPAVAKTLLRHRDAYPHRFAFVATTLAEAIESLRFFAEHPDSGNQLRGKGIYAGRVETNLFGDRLNADQDYVQNLTAAGHYNRLAGLWTVGFPIDWTIVHPQLDLELPAYLPPPPCRANDSGQHPPPTPMRPAHRRSPNRRQRSPHRPTPPSQLTCLRPPRRLGRSRKPG